MLQDVRTTLAAEYILQQRVRATVTSTVRPTRVPPRIHPSRPSPQLYNAHNPAYSTIVGALQTAAPATTVVVANG